MLLSTSLFAQSFAVQVNGNEVADGETVQIRYNEFPANWLIPDVLAIYELDPEICVVTDAEQMLTVSVSDEVKDGVLQNCAFESCIPVNEESCPATSSGMLPMGETKLSIHLGYGIDNPGAELERSFQVSVSNGTQTVSFTVTFVIGAETPVRNVRNATADVASYMLNGMRTDVNSLSRGACYIRAGKKYLKK